MARTTAPEATPESNRPARKTKAKAGKKGAHLTPDEALVPKRTKVASPVNIPMESEGKSAFATSIEWLYGLTDIERSRAVKYDESTFKLDRMRKLLAHLDNPHEQLRCVHVAGTVGKGSTVAMISSMLREGGFTVGSYTSPHLQSICERVQINGANIDEGSLANVLGRVRKAAEKLKLEISFFEAMTAAAFLHYVEEAVDIVVVEVGLGGRLDSTNVITPILSVVTSIDFDHTQFLGSTLAAIAREKAGIFKPGVPVITFEPQPEVLRVFEEVAAAIGAPLRIVNRDVEYSSRFCVTPDMGPHTRICLYTRNTRLEHLPVPLPGEHQAVNCGIALGALDTLKSCGFSCSDEQLASGLAKVRMQGRMEVVSERPRVMVDGAHNPASLNALMKCVGSQVPYDSMVCIFGCCADKDVPAMLDAVSLGADKVIFTRSMGNPRAADPTDLQRTFNERSGKMSQVTRTIREALELAHRAVGRDDLICVTGSFYVAGEARKRITAEREARARAMEAAAR